MRLSVSSVDVASAADVGGRIDESGASTVETLAPTSVTGIVVDATRELSKETSAYSEAELPEVRQRSARSVVVSVWISPTARLSVDAQVCTVMSVVSALPSLAAMMFEVPTATAVTSPALETVATDGVTLAHAIVRPVSVCPAESVVRRAELHRAANDERRRGRREHERVDWRCGHRDRRRSGLSFARREDRRGARPPLPSRVPSFDTVATAVLDELHATVRPVRTLPLASFVCGGELHRLTDSDAFVGGVSVTDATGSGGGGPVVSPPPPPHESASAQARNTASVGVNRRASERATRMKPRRAKVCSAGHRCPWPRDILHRRLDRKGRVTSRVAR